jgi:AcrR family transcriptional regulator
LDKTTETAPGAPGDRAARILRVAREIIRESGGFELSMRELASRGHVSLRTPYELFGSKAGIIRALLKEEQVIFQTRLWPIGNSDIFDYFFATLTVGVAFYAENQPFYRALFRATHGYSGGNETEPARENPQRFAAIMGRAARERLLDPDIDIKVLSETLMDIFAANTRTWASSTYDISLVEPRIGFGWASILAGVAVEPHAQRLRHRAKGYQDQLKEFEAPARGVLSGSD